MRGNPGASNITTSQLAAAIQAVTGTGSMGPAASYPSMPSTSQGVMIFHFTRCVYRTAPSKISPSRWIC